MFEWLLLFFVVVFFFLFGIRVIDQWQKAIVLRLGKYSRTLGPGFNLIIPFFERSITVDLRIATIDIPKQEVITKDTVPVNVNAVVYYKVIKPEDAVIKIQDYSYALSQYAQTALRDVIGNSTLQEALQDRDKIADEIRTVVDEETDEWGIDVTAIKVQDIELPMDMKRAMAREAEAERERRAQIIISSGEVQASKNLALAAKTLSDSPGALHLRTLQTLADVSADQSNTLVFVTPVEVLDAFRRFSGKK
ncbi:MAG: SPFH domain-containing protein [Candidatus Micrarchaeota archaeon]